MVALLPIEIVKCRGRRPSEPFNREKLYASIYAACLSVHSPDGLAADAAAHVCDVILTWMHDKTEITSTELRHQATIALEAIHPDAAYLYKHHKQIM